MQVHRAAARFSQRWDASAAGASQNAEAAECAGRRIKIIAMSVYGQAANFIDGAEANARIAHEIYPGWVLRVYTSSGAAVTARLRAAGAEVIEMQQPEEGILGMFWRFFAASDPCAGASANLCAPLLALTVLLCGWCSHVAERRFQCLTRRAVRRPRDISGLRLAAQPARARGGARVGRGRVAHALHA